MTVYNVLEGMICVRMMEGYGKCSDLMWDIFSKRFKGMLII